MSETDRKIVPSNWIDGNNWIIRSDRQYANIEHFTILTSGGVSATFKTSVQNQLSAWYLLMASVLMIAVLYMLAQITLRLMSDAKNRQKFT